MDVLDGQASSGSETSLLLSATETRVVVRGELGHADWKLVRQGCDIAKRGNHPLIFDLGKCTEVNRWGVGVILNARERVGSVFLHGCSDKVTYYFDGLGICDICGKRRDPVCNAKRNEFRPLSLQEFNGLCARRGAADVIA